MAIRITGMYSGLDTESIISELVSAQSVKKNSMVKAQTKLSWKQDAWKALNTKIYNFYTNVLDDMQFQASYKKKTTKVSNSSAVSIVTGADAVNGVQNLRIDKLAKAGYLTGGDITGADGTKYSSSSKLSELGIADSSSFSVEVNGKSVDIEVGADTTIGDVVKKLQAAGVNASFDAKNQRFFVSSKDTGKDNNFNLIAGNANGFDALDKLGMLTLPAADDDNNPYKAWSTISKDMSDTRYKAAYDTEIARRAAAYKASNDALTKANEALEKKNEELKAQKDDDTLTADDKQKIQDQIDENLQKMSDNNATINNNLQYYSVDGDGNVTATAQLETDEGQDVKDSLDSKIDTANKVMDGINGIAGGYKPAADSASSTATKIAGEDAVISLNGAIFTSDTNTFEINGLTMTMLDETKEPITLTTGEDTDGIYNMVKNFITEYNKLINEMSALYNAESSKGYEPLTSEEKDAMSDSEIEEWEKKIKDSLLRRDSTLGTVSEALKSIMLKGATVNGKQMYLSDFGINTLGYFNAADNEKSAYHIDGDEDDINTRNETDILRAMIASDPDTVMGFFTELSKSLHNDLFDKMAATDYSSALTVYNDKQMKKDYDAYTEKIAKEETKLNNLMDKWYKKFSKMETAMSRLESKNSALSSMLGG